MSTLHITRLQARYHLAPSMAGEKTRLDRVLKEVLDYSLETALDRSGFSDSEEICIRRLVVPVRLRLSQTDQDVAASWSLALTEALRLCQARRESNVFVRYGSRNAALWDMLRMVLAENYERAWAWRQLDLWDIGDSPAPKHARAELLRTLAMEAQCVVPIVRAMLSGRDISMSRVHDFFSNLEVREWVMLAKSALRAAGAEPTWIDGVSQPGIAEVPHPVRQAVTMSPFARWTALDHVTRVAEGRYAVAALLLLSDAPEAFHAGSRETRACLDAAAAALYSPATARGVSNPRRSPEFKEEWPPHPDLPSTKEMSFSPGEASATTDKIALRHRALTKYGGLLFLLPAVQASGVLTPGAVSGRPLRWALHQLAMLLVPAEDRDPAALALAGLEPGAKPPSLDQDPPTPEETATLSGYAGAVLEWVTRVLDDPALPSDTVLEFVCCRDAEVMSDPGWLDVCFSLESISTTIRRAGLDLNPGYVPWLGVVVRFLYE